MRRQLNRALLTGRARSKKIIGQLFLIIRQDLSNANCCELQSLEVIPITKLTLLNKISKYIKEAHGVVPMTVLLGRRHNYACARTRVRKNKTALCWTRKQNRRSKQTYALLSTDEKTYNGTSGIFLAKPNFS